MLLEPGFLIIQTLNGLQLSMLLFLLSIGLSVVFGMMNFINLAHGDAGTWWVRIWRCPPCAGSTPTGPRSSSLRSEWR